jgi:hypothetical protein
MPTRRRPRTPVPKVDYDAELAKQGGVCAVCGRPPSPNRRLAVDHDHKTGAYRGLCCYRCNRYVLSSIDRFGVDLMLAGIAYVCDPPAERTP